MNDYQKRAKIWQIEGRVIVCDRCIIKLKNIDSIYDIRFKMGCHRDNCKKDGIYEVKMNF